MVKMRMVEMSDMIYNGDQYFSAQCTIVDPDLKIVVSDSQIPAEHGTEIIYSCSQKHAKKGGTVEAACHDGKITFEAGHEPTPCFRTGI